MFRRWFAAVRGIVVGLVAVLIVGLLPGLPVVPATAVGAPSGAQPDRSVPVRDWRSAPAPAARMEPYTAPEVVWPEADSKLVDLPVDARGVAAAGSVEVGGLPVTVRPVAPRAGAPARVRVEVLDRRVAGVPEQAAAALRVSRADGRTGPAAVRMEVGYSRLRGAFGGDWEHRLGLVRVPACAAAPAADDPGCAGLEWLPSENDVGTATVAAQVELTGEVLAVMAGPSGDTGDFTRTDLKASYSWSQAGPSGDFTWSYPIEVPDVPGGLVPEVGLSYSSGAVDGQTAGENSQPSWIGEGWDYSPPYVERTYRPCFDDRDTTPHWTVFNDKAKPCWRADNAHLVFDGKATEIILGSDGLWHLADDDGEGVSRLTSADNDDDNGEHWRITTTDGTQYWFGRHTLPGGRGQTHSTATNMVFANHSGDACFSTHSPDASKCHQAYRWMLDYVVDPHGNEMVYRYSPEWKSSSVTLPAGTGVTRITLYNYVRSIRPTVIEYGTRVGDDPARLAPARVVFTAGDRCLQDCYLADGKPRTANWPDTPWDLDCPGECAGTALSYFSTKRLTQISAQVRDGSSYRAVDRWDLAHQFPATGNTTSPALWLQSITRTAFAASGSTAFPPVTFAGVRMPNRAFVSESSSTAPRRYRMASIDTETGGRISVDYYEPQDLCLAGEAPPDPHSNARRCFPRGSGSGQTWWHKYLVRQVIEQDLVGGSPDVGHHYSYSNTGSTTAVKWAHAIGPAVWGRRWPTGPGQTGGGGPG